MNDMLVAIPRNVKEFNAAFRKAAQAQDVEATIPASAGFRWRTSHRWQLEALARIAKRAAALGDDDAIRNELRSSIDKDLDGVRTFLTTTVPGYLLKLYESGCTLAGKELQTFLKLLQQLPPAKN